MGILDKKDQTYDEIGKFWLEEARTRAYSKYSLSHIKTYYYGNKLSSSGFREHEPLAQAFFECFTNQTTPLHIKKFLAEDFARDGVKGNLLRYFDYDQIKTLIGFGEDNDNHPSQRAILDLKKLLPKPPISQDDLSMVASSLLDNLKSAWLTLAHAKQIPNALEPEVSNQFDNALRHIEEAFQDVDTSQAALTYRYGPEENFTSYHGEPKKTFEHVDYELSKTHTELKIAQDKSNEMIELLAIFGASSENFSQALAKSTTAIGHIQELLRVFDPENHYCAYSNIPSPSGPHIVSGVLPIVEPKSAPMSPIH